MRDTLLLVLAAIGGSVLISVACAAMWIAGNACVDWYDRLIAKRAIAAPPKRICWTADLHPFRHIVVIYDSLDAFHAHVRSEGELRASRRAGARGESDG